MKNFQSPEYTKNAIANKYYEMMPVPQQSYVRERNEDELAQALLVQPQQIVLEEEKQTEQGGFLNMFKKDEAKIDQRIIYLDGKVYPANYIPNYIRNQKYSIFSFLPMVLFQQFRFFFNFFFLMITLSQFIPILKVGFLFSYLAPLLFVLILTMMKEAYDDIQRYRRDKEANSQQYVRIEKDQNIEVPSNQLKVGDIIEISGNQRVPADCILLSCHDATGTVFIRTDQLDGETDWKLRKAIRHTQQYSRNQNLHTLNASITAEEPKLDIYDFIGVFKLEVGGGEGYRESLTLENTLWCNTYVAAGKVQALVLYTGKQCRSALNSREPRSKMGRLDHELNHLSKGLCIFMCILAFIIVVLQGFDDLWPITFFRQLLLIASIIPISLRVNLDFSKMYFSIGINNDKDIEGTIARNSTIPEELGRVSYILTDKTGTLTQNQMIFKKISLERIQFQSDNTKQLKHILKKQSEKKYPMQDIVERALANQAEGKKQQIPKRNKELITRDIITALALCHNVTPTEEDAVRTFQASSPDEIALVQISEMVGIKLLYRDTQKLKILNAKQQEEIYDILYEFPFSSERKRMGIILRVPDLKGVFFYLKGADTVMKSKVPEVQRGFLMDECETLSREGLRTLVITQKFMLEKDYQDWVRTYEDAKSSLEGREAKCSKAMDILEQDMELLGITGVEDLLQDDIQHTLESIRNAGIAIWMLTGDKVETAQCIAISTGLKSQTQEMFVIKEIEDSLQLQNELNRFGNCITNVLVIDGQSLAVALKDLKLNFLQVACQAPAVVCCRCSPTQKALVTEAIKEYTQKLCLSIGDGGNDVAMIQAADIGVGIVGKEGKQAALASDYSVLKFKYVKDLLLWHGRLSYTRTSVMAQFVMHRGLVISIIQVIFSLIFYNVSIPVYNGWLMLGYATVYTMLPVLCLIFDQDITKFKALEYPELYKALLKGRELTDKTFLIWLWKSIYQGTSIMALTFWFFSDQFIDLVTITFSSLIIIEILNVVSELHKIRFITCLAQLGTILVYFITVYFLREYINVAKIDGSFIKNVLILVIISWAPIHIMKYMISKLYPTESDKIMKKIKVRS